MKCKKCLHYEVCVKLGKPSLYGINQEIGCSAYKDKEKWEEKKDTITNADSIRAMSDEELAELIVKNHPMHAWNKQVREIYFGFDGHRKDSPQRAWLEWLQQSAE